MRSPTNTCLRCLHRRLSTSTAQVYSSRELTKRPLFPTKARAAGESLTFIDYRLVNCVAGSGGNGSISFLREKDLEFGGPDGGNGGNGGHVIFRADSKTTDLSDVKPTIKGQGGQSGGGKCCFGKSGEHTFVPVPLNTLIRRPDASHLDPDEGVLHELIRQDDIWIAARGGAGGHGNSFYVSNAVRKPIKAEFGAKGEVVSYSVEMRVMATAGLVGYPNAGKSTFLRAISRAKPKVASYPFTTLNPHVGMVMYDDFQQVGVADIPGIMEGAHRCVGLGLSFLKHITRCECIFFVLDYTLGDHAEQLASLRHELSLYDPKLLSKESVVLINKSDLIKTQGREHEMALLRSAFPSDRLFFVSARERTGLEEVLVFLRERHDAFLEERQKRLEEQELNSLIGGDVI